MSDVVAFLEFASEVNTVYEQRQIERVGQWLCRRAGIEERIDRVAGNRISGIRVGQLRRMTLHADLDFSTDPAMEGKRLVTPLAVLRFHHIPGGQAGVAIRAEVQRGVHELPLLDRPPGLHPNAVGFAQNLPAKPSQRCSDRRHCLTRYTCRCSRRQAGLPSGTEGESDSSASERYH